jgi:hypothetical protein
MKDKVTKFPISEYQRIRNMQGEFAVPCEVSGRWLLFSRTSSMLREGEFIGVDIMTMTENNKPKKLCGLFITREKCMEVLSKIKAEE